MPQRRIVRDDNVLGGRWRLEGTMVPIADLRRIASLGRAELKRRYAGIDLTDEEIDAVMAFEFPAIRSPSVEIQPQLATVHCECGEDTTDQYDGHTTAIECPCGRTWRLQADLERLSGPRSADLPDDQE